jgi:hypothetical protein
LAFKKATINYWWGSWTRNIFWCRAVAVVDLKSFDADTSNTLSTILHEEDFVHDVFSYRGNGWDCTKPFDQTIDASQQEKEEEHADSIWKKLRLQEFKRSLLVRTTWILQALKMSLYQG